MKNKENEKAVAAFKDACNALAEIVNNFAEKKGVEHLVRKINSAERSDFLRFYVYLCHVSDFLLFDFYCTKASDFSDIRKRWVNCYYPTTCFL